MSKQRDREEFISIMAREVSMTVQDARLILRHAATLHRLAEEECSDERAYNRMVRIQEHCPLCEHYPNGTQTKPPARVCPEHSAARRVQAICKRYNTVPVFQGDPRGCVVKLRVPSGYNNSWGGEGLVCVP